MTGEQSAGPSTRNGASAVPLYAALTVCIVSQAYLAWSFGALTGAHRATTEVALSVVLLLAIPTTALLLACRRLQSTDLPGIALLAIALAGLMMRLPYFGAGPLLEDDHFRYLLDGAMTANGLNPYVIAPIALNDGAAPAPYLAVAAAGRDAIAQINFPELRTIYPGMAQLLFATAHLIEPWGFDGLRVVILSSEILTALLCWHLLGKLLLPRHLVALLWCNPLMAFCLSGQAHIDAAIGPLALLAVTAALRSSGAIAGAAIGLAIGVKLWPVMLAPVLLRSLGQQRRAQLAFLAAMGSVALLMCTPLLLASLTPNAGLVAYARGWQINNMPYEWVSYAGYVLVGDASLERYLRGIVMSGATAVAVALALRPISNDRDLVARLAVVAGAVFYLSPAQFPWYASWFVPFAVLARSWALLVATAALPTYFLFFLQGGLISGEVYRFWLSGLHLLPVVAIVLLQRLRRPGLL